MKLLYEGESDGYVAISLEQIENAERVLKDYGIKNPREVLQKVGFALLDDDLYPFEDSVYDWSL